MIVAFMLKTLMIVHLFFCCFMLIAAKSVIGVKKLKTLLEKEFDMKDLGAAKKILRMEIRRDGDARNYDYLRKVM